jgi:hypothetical protein
MGVKTFIELSWDYSFKISVIDESNCLITWAALLVVRWDWSVTTVGKTSTDATPELGGGASVLEGGGEPAEGGGAPAERGAGHLIGI